MWLKYSDPLIVADKVACSKGVAFYDGEELVMENGTLTLCRDKLVYASLEGMMYLPTKCITSVSMRPGSLTKSPKIVLVTEMCKVKCYICAETTVVADSCAHCGSNLFWTCEVCDHESNQFHLDKCMECGSKSGNSLDGAEKMTNVFLLSFRKEAPTSMFKLLSSMSNSQNSVAVQKPAIGVAGLIDRAEALTIERDFAIAAIDGEIDSLMDAADDLLNLANELAKHGRARNVLKELGIATGLFWRNMRDLELVLEGFLYEQIFKNIPSSPNALLLSDLYCFLNRACALGLFVSMKNFLIIINNLEKGGKIVTRTINDIKFVQSIYFDDQVILKRNGITAADVSGIPSLLSQAILEEGVRNGVMCIDCLYSGQVMYYQNIFLQ